MSTSLEEIRKSIIFAIGNGRLSDTQSMAVPNFSRLSSARLEQEINSSVSLRSLEANIPAIDPVDGSFLLEPYRRNVVTWNLDLKQLIWQKGSSVLVRGDATVAPDGSHRGERVSWGAGSGNTQLIQRTFTLRAGVNYYVSALVKLVSGKFSSSDEMIVSGQLTEAVATKLSLLNNFVGNYRWLDLAFTTQGRQPVLPDTGGQELNYTVSSVSANSISLTGISGVTNGDLVGGRIRFSNNATKNYEITGNALVGGTLTVTTKTEDGNLVTDGVTTSSTAQLVGAADVTVTLQFYCESAATIDWGGLQLEEGTFRTSMVYQDAEVIPRAATTLIYRKQSNPLTNLSTFAVFLDIKNWRGDGNLLSAGNLSIQIVNSKLSVTAGSITLASPNDVPSSASILVQISSETFTLSIYINHVLVARTSLSGFKATASSISLTSDGVRLYRQIIVFGKAFSDGSISTGENVRAEVLDLFMNPAVDSGSISATAPEIVLPMINIPAPETPAARSVITAINIAGKTVDVESGTTFGTSGGAILFRSSTDGERRIGYVNITGKTANTITLDSVTGIQLGDILVSDYVPRPGRSSMRLPFVPIDPQAITAIDVGNKRVSISSALAFVERRRCIVQSPMYQDVAELIVESVDSINNTLTLSSVSNLTVGDIISQPDEEMEVHPSLYYVDFMVPDNFIYIEQKAANGFVLANTGTTDSFVQPKIRIYL